MKMHKTNYTPKYIETLFDEMSGSYGRVNYITSFGFSSRWRAQCVAKAAIKPDSVVLDLMTGMGECWNPILRASAPEGTLIAIDFSDGMLQYANKKRLNYKEREIEVRKENVLNSSLESNSVDHIISGFGMKTFSDEQLQALAIEMKRVLKPNGTFSLIDISVPKNRILRFIYLFYLKSIIPLLGWLLLGNPECYKMLGVYTEAFKNAKATKAIFQKAGLNTQYHQYFFGCATGVYGEKT